MNRSLETPAVRIVMQKSNIGPYKRTTEEL